MVGGVVDLKAYKYIKTIMKYGVPKHKAQEIVSCAMEAGNGAYIEMYIKYAISLNYGM